MFKESVHMANSNPFGVGLGNFFDQLSNKNLPTGASDSMNKISLGALTAGTHNIFFQYLAESGYIGLISFCILLLLFAFKDFKILNSPTNSIKKTFILSFWTLIIIVQFFPAINLSFYTIFFLLRAHI